MGKGLWLPPGSAVLGSLNCPKIQGNLQKKEVLTVKGQHQKTVRALLGSVREYKKPSLLCPVFVVLEVLMEVLVPGVMALMIDKGMSGGSIGYILKIGAVLLVMSMMALVFGILAGTNAARASAGMARNLRKDMFHHIQEFSFSNIDRFSPSSLVTRLTTDITNV